ncbi:recombinase family protein [Luteibacter sp. RCC_6_2]|uniref:recombinase family protein n=1 Tax=Luteibacter sp. RCC_6_2 TaxID=3239223 RepID=UPI00352439D2
MAMPPAPGKQAVGTPVAEYVRMSTDHQVYSPAQQSAAITAFAVANRMRIVRRYLDHGRSGLDLSGRPALRRLLADVRSGTADFQAVLVYDVSRWGRFQEADEAAFYEYLCMLGGVRVIYVAEPFANDQSPLSAMLKGLKRAMAAEYSRELSVKVFAGQARLVALGFRQGSTPGYGLRRALLDAAGRLKGLLDVGDRKSLATDRVILVPGPAEEVRVVNVIFRRYLSGMSQRDIARELNAAHIGNFRGDPWCQQAIRSVLVNEKYIGNNIFARSSKRLRQPKTLNPPDAWVRCNGAYTGIVPPRIFWRAQAVREARCHIPTDAEMLAPLRQLLATHGYLTVGLIEQAPGAWSGFSYVRRFGSFRNIYALLGYRPPRNLAFQDARRRAARWLPSLLGAITERLEDAGAAVVAEGSRLTIDATWSLSVGLIRPSLQAHGWRWPIVRLPPPCDILLLARMDRLGNQPLDYFIAPTMAFAAWPQALYQHNDPLIQRYLFPSLAVLPALAMLSARPAGHD